MQANIGHRVGHQSGVDESSGKNAAAILNVFAFHVYLVFSEIGNSTTHLQILIFVDQRGHCSTTDDVFHSMTSVCLRLDVMICRQHAENQ